MVVQALMGQSIPSGLQMSVRWGRSMSHPWQQLINIYGPTNNKYNKSIQSNQICTELEPTSIEPDMAENRKDLDHTKGAPVSFGIMCPPPSHPLKMKMMLEQTIGLSGTDRRTSANSSGTIVQALLCITLTFNGFVYPRNK